MPCPASGGRAVGQAAVLKVKGVGFADVWQ